MTLVDSHCHLDFPKLREQRDFILERARAAGLSALVNISTSRKDMDEVVRTAEQTDLIYATVGMHPHHTDEDEPLLTTGELVERARHPKVVGIGETGLDYYYEYAGVDFQKKSFFSHCEAAQITGLPLIVHSREAEEDTLALLETARQTYQGELRGVLHCFSSRRILAEEALKIGFYISLSGILTFKKSTELRDIVRDIPLDRLLVETDSPYLAPEPHRGKTCEPSYVIHTAQVLADLKKVSLEEIARQTTDNFYKLFSKVPRHL